MEIKIGTTVGNWIVTSDKFKEKGIFWNKCECICGTTRNVRTWWLNNSKTKGCGCSNIKGRFLSKAYNDLSLSYYNSFIYSRKSKGKNFSEEITIEYLWNLFIKQNKKCAISNIDIVLNPRWSQQNQGKGTKLIQTASLDRIDSTKDYTTDNIQWVHKSINLMKGQLTDLQFITICKIISNHNSNIQIVSSIIEDLKWRPNLKF